MRPKVVILTLAIAFAALGLVALLKGMNGKKDGNAGGLPATAATAGASTTNSLAASQSNQNFGATALGSNILAADQLRALAIQKELDDIFALQNQADGTNNLTIIIPALVDKVQNPEVEVRTAALDALKMLDDTNAVPGLQQAADTIKDPRGKVAVLDTIDYLKLPAFGSDAPADYTYTPTDRTNRSRKISMNANFKPKGKKSKPGLDNSGSQQAAPESIPAGQPQ